MELNYFRDRLFDLLNDSEGMGIVDLNADEGTACSLSGQRTGMYLKSYADRQRGRRTDGRPQTDCMLWTWQLQAISAADSFTR